MIALGSSVYMPAVSLCFALQSLWLGHTQFVCEVKNQTLSGIPVPQRAYLSAQVQTVSLPFLGSLKLPLLFKQSWPSHGAMSPRVPFLDSLCRSGPSSSAGLLNN